LLILLVNLVALGAIAIKYLSLVQAPQIVCMVVAVGVGLTLGISWARLRHWSIRAALIAGGLVVAAAAWWFVPTFAGINRWTAENEARRLHAELETMPVGDGVAYQANLEARDRLLAEFPDLGSRFEEISRAWEEQSYEDWKKRLETLAPGDVEGLKKLRDSYAVLHNADLEEAELAWFGRTYTDMTPGDIAVARAARSAIRSHPYWTKQIETWEGAWAARTVAEAVAKAESRLSSDPARASADLHQLAMDLKSLAPHENVQQKLMTARRQAFQASMAATQRQALRLMRDEQYQAASAEVLKLKNELSGEAEALGLDTELAQIVDGYGFLADLARQAGQPDGN
jgi:hypothetical protein